jgi:hypothetical protein
MGRKKGGKYKPVKAKKSAAQNQWVSTGLAREVGGRERRDGPGGEDGVQK